MKSKLIDISPALSPRTAVWPGDVSLSRQVALDLATGHNLTLSSFTSTVHLGAHADAPSHFVDGGASIDELDLEPYCGPCEVFTVDVMRSELIEPMHLALAFNRRTQVERLLVRTLSQPDPTVFNQDFAAFSAAAVDLCGSRGVRLLGIDTASVDPFASKDLPAHHALAKWSMRNLEGLCLADVADGSYELFAFPLKLVGFDASPVRAVLRRL